MELYKARQGGTEAAAMAVAGQVKATAAIAIDSAEYVVSALAATRSACMSYWAPEIKSRVGGCYRPDSEAEQAVAEGRQAYQFVSYLSISSNEGI